MKKLTKEGRKSDTIFGSIQLDYFLHALTFFFMKNDSIFDVVLQSASLGECRCAEPFGCLVNRVREPLFSLMKSFLSVAWPLPSLHVETWLWLAQFPHDVDGLLAKFWRNLHNHVQDFTGKKKTILLKGIFCYNIDLEDGVTQAQYLISRKNLIVHGSLRIYFCVFSLS